MVNKIIVLFFSFLTWTGHSQSVQTLMNEPLDLSKDFKDYTNTYFLADSLVDFDPATSTGQVLWRRAEYFPAHAFNYTQHGLKRTVQNEFPAREYAQDPKWKFSLEFIDSRTVRMQMHTGISNSRSSEHLMIPDEIPHSKEWQYRAINGGHEYTSVHGSIRISTYPWSVQVLDINGKILTSTKHPNDNAGFCQNLPFCYVRRASDYSRSVGAVFSLLPDEKIYGFGESFSKLNKMGQKVQLYTCDPNGVETNFMYKPIPFFMSNKGYGMFMHTSSPITCDIGQSYGASNALLIGDETLDLFIFIGKPKEILEEYTNLTGKAPMPPLWSFGLWMSRITYFSEKDGRDVAAKLRQHKIPADVLHFDTGWFETDWQCDYEFSKNRFPDAPGMIKDLASNGFKTCLWQLPYFVPKNKLFNEIIEKDLYVKNDKGNIPFEDAVLDFTNPKTIEWYTNKLKGLLDMGVSAIKVDFGEAAPFDGIYSNGRTGFYEHNLYPLRYNKIVSDLTKLTRGERIIWARSTWAGSQRYPIHWGGDAESSDMGMEAQLRGGLSLGLSGFTFWSHDIGGFTKRTPEDLYRRWLPFGIFSSHTRCHGQPPKEPWDYSPAFEEYFRSTVELKYQLMPYVYTQSLISSQKGWPVIRSLFFEFPDDQGTWDIDNEYMFGENILVAPIFETGSTSRSVYLPKGNWIDFQTKKSFSSGWHTMQTDKLNCIILVKEGTVLPVLKSAQHTGELDWDSITLNTYGNNGNWFGHLAYPDHMEIHDIKLSQKPKKAIVPASTLPSRSKFLIQENK